MRFPVYIVSKGRWESRLTSRALEEMRIPYQIVVEPQEYDQYAAVIEKTKILVLPFSDLGLGSIPARNWIWEHSISRGNERHWIMDDNIRHFVRRKPKRVNVLDDAIFRAMEDFVERYENIALAGPGYRFFSVTPKAPFLLNTRIYSCILILNSLTHRWRGRYNEDTDLSLRVLKDGWCTVQFWGFLQDKIATLTMKGGNTDSLYQGDGRLRMAKSLIRQHPDIVKLSWKWGRWQHHVDYRPFKRNRLKLKKGIDLEKLQPNEYGMRLIQI